MTNQNDDQNVLITEEQQALLDKQGWFHEYGEVNGVLANIHTHGLAENLKHTDLQLALNLEKESVEMLLNILTDNIAEGYRYSEGRSTQVIEGMEVEFKLFEEANRKVLRMILPDDEGRFPSDVECQEPYNKQYSLFE